MIVNENLVNYIFNKANIIKHIFTMLLMLIIMSIVIISVGFNMYKSAYDRYKTTLDNIYTPDYFTKKQTLVVKCKSVNCKQVYVTHEDITYRYLFKSSGLEEDTIKYIGKEGEDDNLYWWNKYLTPDLNLVVRTGNEKYIINDAAYITSAIYTASYLYITLVIIFTIFSCYNIYLSYKNNIYEKGSYKMYTESKVQGNISEMIHHEINAPLAILRSISEDIVAMIKGKTLDKDEREHLMNGFNFALDRLDSILGMLFTSRDIKKEENISLYSVITHIVDSVNKAHVGKLALEFDEDTQTSLELDNYVADNSLGNGNLMNIFNVMLTNSIEASANTITLKLVKKNHKFIDLYIKDNGVGIRDKNNKIFHNAGKIVTSYGYSSKNKDGTHNNNVSMLTKILHKIGIKVVQTDTSRGIGLYMNKTLLDKVGGGIELIETSELGTTFMITIPIKRNHETSM